MPRGPPLLTSDQRYESVAGGVGERKLINPAELFRPPGFSHVAVASGQRLVFVAGQTAIAPDFTIIGEEVLEVEDVPDV